jgi:hypothetical protein
MVTGVETVGLVLAILPLLIEAGKAYSEGVSTIKDLALNSRRDEALGDFYDDFFIETHLINELLRGLVDQLSLCTESKINLKSRAGLDDWEQDEAIKNALQEYLKTEENLNAFLLVNSRILELVDKLTKDKSTDLSKADKV